MIEVKYINSFIIIWKAIFGTLLLTV